MKCNSGFIYVSGETDIEFTDYKGGDISILLVPIYEAKLKIPNGLFVFQA